MLGLQVILFIIITFVTGSATGACHFGYSDDDGPSKWGLLSNNQCLGKHQSPIDITKDIVKRTVLPPLRLVHFNETLAATLINNGHTAMMTIDSEVKPFISGGPLPAGAEYEFSQLHFHWGANDSCGSEDQINHHRYPMEVHFVFFKKEYLDANSAMGYSDGLCVLASVFKIQNIDNHKYVALEAELPQIIQANSNVTLKDPPALFDLLPLNLMSYFSYHGSLTTPPCSEVVTWIDFNHPVYLSHNQFEPFRNLLDSDDKKMVNNFRVVQPLGDRTVLYATHQGIDDDTMIQQTIRFFTTLSMETTGSGSR